MIIACKPAMKHALCPAAVRCRAIGSVLRGRLHAPRGSVRKGKGENLATPSGGGVSSMCHSPA